MAVRVVRSARRRRTVSARFVGQDIEVRVPAHLPAAVTDREVARLVARLTERARRLEMEGDGEALVSRCHELSARYLGGRAEARSVEYVREMSSRWASVTPDRAAIRLSAETRAWPGWVRDYLLVHELAHLLVPGHGPAFWRLVRRYPRTERARGYLMARADARRAAAGPAAPSAQG